MMQEKSLLILKKGYTFYRPFNSDYCSLAHINAIIPGDTTCSAIILLTKISTNKFKCFFKGKVLQITLTDYVNAHLNILNCEIYVAENKR